MQKSLYHDLQAAVFLRHALLFTVTLLNITFSSSVICTVFLFKLTSKQLENKKVQSLVKLEEDKLKVKEYLHFLFPGTVEQVLCRLGTAQTTAHVISITRLKFPLQGAR